MTKIIFGIVTFREKFWETPSFNSLVASAKHLGEKVNIFVFDNTDFAEWNICEEYSLQDNFKVKYKHDRRNPGIAVAYNTIAEYAKSHLFSHIVFLDQDTELPENFCLNYSKVAENMVDIAAPLIYANGKLLSPARYKNYRSYSYGIINDDSISLKQSTCINSGLLVKTDLFLKAGGYNEKLRLDFCDHEFIIRIGKLIPSVKIIHTKLEQDFSVNTNTLDNALFRYQLYINDLRAFRRINNNDYKVTLFVDLPHLFRLTLQYKSFAFIKRRFLNQSR